MPLLASALMDKFLFFRKQKLHVIQQHNWGKDVGW